MEHHRAALDATKDFLAFVRDAENPKLRDLALRLDNLAAKMWPLEDRAFGEMPESLYRETRDAGPRWYALIGPRFPKLGLYTSACFNTEDPTPRETDVCDAVDDVADICRDLEEALALERATDAVQAAEHLRWSYWAHWGRHLRSLQLHLYDLMTNNVL